MVFHAAALFYTRNLPYGQGKFLGILFNVILNILALRFILVNFNYDIFKKIIEVILISGFALTLLSVSSGPFISFYDEFMQMKLFGIGLYSHVGFGRYMGFVFLIALVNMIYLNFFRKFHLDKIFFLVSFAGLILSGLRGAILSSLLIATTITIYSLREKNISPVKIFSFLGAGLLLIGAAVYFNNSFSILFSRFTQIFNIFDLEHLTDGAIQTRLHIYRNSFEIFMQHYFIGRGLGSYNDESLFIYTKGLKYPHNIFIEYGIELGTIGLIFILAVLTIIYRSVLKINIILTFIFLYFVLLAMFSYSIPFQTGLFAFIAFVSLKPGNIKILKNIFSREGDLKSEI